MSNSGSSKSVRRRAPVLKEQCPLAQAAELLGDRWTLLILREAFYGVVRYGDMLSDLDAPRSMLTDRLTKLVDNKLMKRMPYQESGSRTRQAYVLTQAGRELSLTLIALSQWSEANLSNKRGPVTFVEKHTGAPLRVALIDDEESVIPLSEAEIRLRT